MSFTYVLGKMLSLAVMMILGFIAKRRGILSAKTNRDLSELVVDITTPCMMLASLSATEASRHTHTHTYRYTFFSYSFPLWFITEY